MGTRETILTLLALAMAGVSPLLIVLGSAGVVPMPLLFWGALVPGQVVFWTILLYARARNLDCLYRRLWIGVVAGILLTMALDVVRGAGVQIGYFSDSISLFGRLITGGGMQAPVTPVVYGLGVLYHFASGIAFGVVYSVIFGAHALVGRRALQRVLRGAGDDDAAAHGEDDGTFRDRHVRDHMERDVHHYAPGPRCDGCGPGRGHATLGARLRGAVRRGTAPGNAPGCRHADSGLSETALRPEALDHGDEMGAARRPRGAEETRPDSTPLWQWLVPRPALRHLAHTGAVPGKEMRDVAALFVDIEGCARLCEDLPPRRMNEVIEIYFSGYLDAVRAAEGEVTEVLGDGLVALFEAPKLQQAVRGALEAALAIKARTRTLNRRRRQRHDPIVVNMGLEAGRALTGFTRLRGGSGERWIYAASGPVTNVAARLCALARHGQILTTRKTAELLLHRCRCRSLGPRRLKNVARPVEVIQIRPRGRNRSTASAHPTAPAEGRLARIPPKGTTP